MSKKSLRFRAIKKKLTYLKYVTIKKSLCNLLPTLSTSKLYIFLLHILPKNSSITTYRNICPLTGRSRGTFRFFGLSRMKIRETLQSLSLPCVYTTN